MSVCEPPETRGVVGGQPWLAASLSWLFPGMGQFYCGAHVRAVGFIVLLGILQIGRVVFLISDRLSASAALVLYILTWTVLGVYASVDAFRATRTVYPLDGGWRRASGRNPYFAVFLSVVMTGAGHMYMRRWTAGIVFLIAALALHLIAVRNAYASLALIALWTLAPAHVLVAYATNSSKGRPQATWLVIGLIATSTLAAYGLSLMSGLAVASARNVGDSMAPTMVSGSYAILDKLTYRYKEPAVGDIVMFAPPRDVGAKAGLRVCKRIVAIGGQTIQVRDGFVYVDGQYKEPAPIHGPFPLSTGSVGREDRQFPYAVVEPYHVPENHYFVMGDNRDDSRDSRSYGPVPRESIIGRVARVYTLPYFRSEYDRRLRYRGRSDAPTSDASDLAGRSRWRTFWGSSGEAH